MVLAQETNFVYLSEALWMDYPKECSQLTEVLERQNIDYGFLKNTKSIWCRDYMPVQLERNRFVLFQYQPSYLDGKRLLTKALKICEDIGITPRVSDIILDGGNITSWKDKSILTDRIFDENPHFSSRIKLINQLEKDLNSEIIIIPQIKSSQRGHVDSLLRFYDESTLIGNDRDEEYTYWSRDISNVLQDYQFNYIDIPSFHWKDENYWYNDIGSYINFLEVDNLIVVPQFEAKNNQDQSVIEELQFRYPNRAIEGVNLNKVALDGGVLNSATWTVLK